MELENQGSDLERRTKMSEERVGIWYESINISFHIWKEDLVLSFSLPSNTLTFVNQKHSLSYKQLHAFNRLTQW